MQTNAKSEAADNNATRTRPFTAEEYVESIRDGREIWIYGERVKDVTVHPAFRNTVRMLARLYDALYQGILREMACWRARHLGHNHGNHGQRLFTRILPRASARCSNL